MFMPVGHSKKTLNRMDQDRLQAELEEKAIREENAREIYKNRSQAQMAGMKPKKLGLGGGADNKKKYALEDDEEMDHNENLINTKIALMEQAADELKEGALDISAGLDLSNRYIDTMTENVSVLFSGRRCREKQRTNNCNRPIDSTSRFAGTRWRSNGFKQNGMGCWLGWMVWSNRSLFAGLNFSLRTCATPFLQCLC